MKRVPPRSSRRRLAGELLEQRLLLNGDDTFDTAQGLTTEVGVEAVFAGEIEDVDDVDLFAVDLVAGQQVMVHIDTPGPASGLDTYLRVFDGIGDEVAFSHDAEGSTDSELTFSALYTEPHYFGVSSWMNSTYDPYQSNSGSEGQATGNYELRLLVSQPTAGETLFTAHVIDVVPGDPQYVSREIEELDDVDLYRVDVEEGQSLSVSIEAAIWGSELDSYLTVFDVDGFVLASNDDSAGSTDSMVELEAAPYDDVYYIGVSSKGNESYDPRTSGSGKGGLTTGFYDLVILLHGVDDDTLEAATIVQPEDGRSDFNEELKTARDIDIYALSVPADQIVSIDVDAASKGADVNTVLRIFDGDGNELGRSDDVHGVDPAIHFSPVTAGTFYIGVSTHGNDAYDPLESGSGTLGSEGGSYSLRIRLAPPDGDDIVETATPLVLDTGREYDFVGTIGHVGDVDLIRLELSAGQRLLAEIGTPLESNSSGETLESGLRFFDAAGNELARSDNLRGVPASFIVEAPLTGSYFIGVAAWDNHSYDPRATGGHVGNTAGEYELTLLLAPKPITTEVEPNDNLASSNLIPLELGGFTATLDVDDLDFYEIVTLESGRLRVGATPEHGGVDLALSLYAADGRRLVVSADRSADDPRPLLDQYVSRGRYFVAVSGESQSAEGVRYLFETVFESVAPPLSGSAVGDRPDQVIWADLNHDGHLDLLTRNRRSDDVSLLMGRDGGLFAPERRLATGNNPLSLGIGDFNGDGHPDLVAGSGGTRGLSVLLGHGDGTFADPATSETGDRLSDLVVRDFDHDGRLDLASLDDFDDGLFYRKGRGDGSFDDATHYPISFPSSLRAADINGDGHLDMAVAGVDLSILLGNGLGEFQVAGTLPGGDFARRFIVDDFNTDGILDFVVYHSSSKNLAVILGKGEGIFESPRTLNLAEPAEELLGGDFNKDGHVDLAVLTSFNTLFIFLNDSEGGLEQAASFLAVTGGDLGPAGSLLTESSDIETIDTADFDRDGNLDLLLVNDANDQVLVVFGNGDGSFQHEPRIRVGAFPKSLVVADFDHDGRPDLATANALSGDVSVLLGDGAGALRETPKIPLDAVPEAIEAADFNRDGRLDLAISVESNFVTLLPGFGDGRFGAAVQIPVGEGSLRDLEVRDYDGDGIWDLALIESSLDFGPPARLQVLLGRGDATFDAPRSTLVEPDAGLLSSGDFNGDGIPDMAVVASRDLTIWTGQGDGTFSPGASVSFSKRQRFVVSADLNEDGLDDLALYDKDGTSQVSEIIVLLSETDGTLRELPRFFSGYNTRMIVPFDFNLDGTLDLITANSGERTTGIDIPGGVRVHFGVGDGSFLEGPDLFVSEIPTAVGVADFNGDARPDLAVARGRFGDVSMQLNAGDAGFLDALQEGLRLRHAAPQVADLDQDGAADVLFFNGHGEIFLRSGRPLDPGTFDPPRLLNPITRRPASNSTAFPFAPANATVLLNTVGEPHGSQLLAVADKTRNSVSIYTFSPDSSLQPHSQLTIGSLLGDLVAGDLNGDGRDDLVAYSAGSQRLFVALQTTGGDFIPKEHVPLTGPIGELAIADIDAHPGPELIFTEPFSGTVTVLPGRNDGTFAEPMPFRSDLGVSAALQEGDTSRLRSRSQTATMAIEDFDQDGWLDVIVLNPGSRQATWLAGNSSGLSNPRPIGYVGPATVVRSGDFDSDGWPDLALLEPDIGHIVTMKNLGNGDFLEVSRNAVGESARGLTFVDVDADDRLDILVGNSSADVLVLHGRGNGEFRPFQRVDRQMDLAVLDVDGDGWKDVVVANESLDRVSVQYGADGHSFAAGFQQDRSQGLLAPGAVEPADINNDSFVDLLVANSGGNEILVYLGAPSGFQPPRHFFAGANPVAMAVDDLDGNGLLDIAVANEGSNDVSLLLGQTDDDGWHLATGSRLQLRQPLEDGGEILGRGPNSIEVVRGEQELALTITNGLSNNVFQIPSAGGGFFLDNAPLVFPVQNAPQGTFTGEFDGAPGIDLVVINTGSNSLTLFSNSDPARRSNLATGGLSPSSAVSADFNNDGLLDLLVAHRGDGTFTLLLGGGGGLLQEHVFAIEDIPHPADLALAELAGSEELRLLVLDEGDDLVRVLGPKEYLAPSSSTSEPSSLLSSAVVRLGSLLLQIVRIPTLRLVPNLSQFSAAFIRASTEGVADFVTTLGSAGSQSQATLPGLASMVNEARSLLKKVADDWLNEAPPASGRLLLQSLFAAGEAVSPGLSFSIVLRFLEQVSFWTPSPESTDSAMAEETLDWWVECWMDEHLLEEVADESHTKNEAEKERTGEDQRERANARTSADSAMPNSPHSERVGADAGSAKSYHQTEVGQGCDTAGEDGLESRPVAPASQRRLHESESSPRMSP